MLKTSTKKQLVNTSDINTNSAIELTQWPVHSSQEEAYLSRKVLAIQSTRLSPINNGESNNNAYNSFNLGLHVGDCAKQVACNRQSLQTLFPNETKIQWLEQVHGSSVAEISRVTEETVIADAMLTREKNIALAIMTADCLPILLTSKQGDEIAAIHGGWRPLSANIIANTISKMHTTASDIYAWLGPCIGNEVFEVGAEVQKIFVDQNSLFSQAFQQHKTGKYLADLHKIASLQLQRLGVTRINTLSECTYTQTEKYYSYRKTPITGRMATVISLL